MYNLYNKTKNAHCVVNNFAELIDRVKQFSGNCFILNGVIKLNHSVDEYGIDRYDKIENRPFNPSIK